MIRKMFYDKSTVMFTVQYMYAHTHTCTCTGNTQKCGQNTGANPPPTATTTCTTVLKCNKVVLEYLLTSTCVCAALSLSVLLDSLQSTRRDTQTSEVHVHGYSILPADGGNNNSNKVERLSKHVYKIFWQE